MTVQRGAYRGDIDGLRAIAVLSVILYHAQSTILPGGYIGVDVFFVISGFLISGILSREVVRGSFLISSFYKRRVLRLYPPLIVVVVSCLVVGYNIFGLEEFKNFGLSICAAVVFSANFLFWSQSGYFDTSSSLKPLLHLWSLGVEEQFYLFWPFLVLVLAKRSRETVSAVFVLIAACSFAVAEYGALRGASWSFYLPFSRIWELALGALLSHLMSCYALRPNWFIEEMIGVAGLTTILAGSYLINNSLPFPGAYALPPTLGAAAVLFAQRSFVNSRVLSSNVLVGLGLVSYSLYLWHWPVLAILRQVSDQEPTGLALSLAVVAALALSIATYFVVEKPIRFGASRTRPVTASLALVGASLVLGCVGGAIYAADGVPGRLPRFWREFEEHPYMFAFDQRVFTCFQTETSDPHVFPQSCDERNENTRKPSVLLWGDSFAAALYPGMREASQSLDFALIQFDTARCPPLLGYSSVYRNCQANNDWVEARIKANPPDVVVMTAAWRNYNLLHVSDGMSDLDRDLTATLEKLRQDGVRKTVVVGSVTQWNQLLSQIVRNHLRSGASLPPERLPVDYHLYDRLLNDEVKKISLEQHADYVDPREYLCDADGCLVRTGNAPSDLTTWDGDHLTPAGSKYLVSRLYNFLLADDRSAHLAAPPSIADTPDRSLRP